MNNEFNITREDFLKRCETVYEKGFANRKLFALMQNWIDFVMRFEHTMFSNGQTFGSIILDFIDREKYHLEKSNNKTLANDEIAYAMLQVAAILSHPCQKCAEDKDAWHTRTSFCLHENNKNGF